MPRLRGECHARSPALAIFPAQLRRRVLSRPILRRHPRHRRHGARGFLFTLFLRASRQPAMEKYQSPMQAIAIRVIPQLGTGVSALADQPAVHQPSSG